jgi:hypothetical protein
MELALFVVVGFGFLLMLVYILPLFIYAIILILRDCYRESKAASEKKE